MIQGLCDQLVNKIFYAPHSAVLAGRNLYNCFKDMTIILFAYNFRIYKSFRFCICKHDLYMHACDHKAVTDLEADRM